MKKLKLITNIIYWLVIFVLLSVAVFTTFSVIEGPGRFRAFVVQSGSMEPAIGTGSVVVVVPQDNYNSGDVITFLANPKASLKDVQATVTHRIVEAADGSFITKGDANEDPDREKVNKNSVLGKVIFSLPLVGYLVGFTKTQTGFILLVVIPGTLIIYSELNNIKKEVKRLYAGWQDKKSLVGSAKVESSLKKKKAGKKK